MPATATRSFEMTIDVDAPISAVWKALTDAQELERWFPLNSDVKPGAGGSILLSWGSPWDGRCDIEIWEPEKHLRTRWPWGTAGPDLPNAPRPLAVDYFLESRGAGTRLRLVHSGFQHGPDWDMEYNGVSSGWSFELRSLKHYVENHRGERRAVAWARRRADLPRDKAWSRLFSKEALNVSPSPSAAKPGTPCSITTGDAVDLSGETLLAQPPVQFAAVVPSLNDALFRVEAAILPPAPGTLEVWAWVSLWGDARDRAKDLEDSLARTLDRALAL